MRHLSLLCSCLCLLIAACGQTPHRAVDDSTKPPHAQADTSTPTPAVANAAAAPSPIEDKPNLTAPVMPHLVLINKCTQIHRNSQALLADIVQRINLSPNAQLQLIPWTEYLGNNEIMMSSAQHCVETVKTALVKQGAKPHRIRARFRTGETRSSACPTKTCSPQHRIVYLNVHSPTVHSR